MLGAITFSYFVLNWLDRTKRSIHPESMPHHVNLCCMLMKKLREQFDNRMDFYNLSTRLVRYSDAYVIIICCFRFEYARSGNPTRKVLETCLASLDGAKHAMTFSSGFQI